MEVIDMIEVIIVPLGIIRELIERGEVILKFDRQEVTVKDLIDELDKKYSISLRDEMTKYNISIMINGYEIEFLKGFNTKLHNGDRIAFIPPVAGGM